MLVSRKFVLLLVFVVILFVGWDVVVVVAFVRVAFFSFLYLLFFRFLFFRGRFLICGLCCVYCVGHWVV